MPILMLNSSIFSMLWFDNRLHSQVNKNKHSFISVSHHKWYEADFLCQRFDKIYFHLRFNFWMLCSQINRKNFLTYIGNFMNVVEWMRRENNNEHIMTACILSYFFHFLSVCHYVKSNYIENETLTVNWMKI